MNPLSLSIVGGSISLIILISIVLTVMDISQDNKLLENNYKDDHQVLKTVFVDLNGLRDANMFQFSFYSTMVKSQIFLLFLILILL